MMNEYDQHRATSGYIEMIDGKYQGKLEIEGIDISPVIGLFFQQDGENWLWIKRKDVMEYDICSGEYIKRKARPYWECYLKKQDKGIVAYRGYFIFSHFKYELSGVFDKFMRDVDRLNLFVDRLPRDEQNIINNINKRNKEQNEKRQ